MVGKADAFFELQYFNYLKFPHFSFSLFFLRLSRHSITSNNTSHTINRNNHFKTMSDNEQYPIVIAGIGAFFNILRFAVDIVSVAGKIEEKKEKAIESNNSDTESVGSNTKQSLRGSMKQKLDKLTRKDGSNVYTSNMGMSTRVFDGRLSVNPGFRFSVFRQRNSHLDHTPPENQTEEGFNLEAKDERSKPERFCSLVSVFVHLGFLLYFVVATVKTSDGSFEVSYKELPLGATTIGMFAGLVMSLKDYMRTRFTHVQRFFYVLSATITMLGGIIVLSTNKSTSTVDIITVSFLIIYFILSLIESKLFGYPVDKDADETEKKAHLGKALLIILKPYFWPSRTSTSALMNRTRAIMTWVCVASSKACTLASPVFLGRAASALARFDYASCARNAIIYSCFQFSSTFLKEMQSLFYLKVAQAAFVQLSEVSFYHLHSLSLDWHLRKKLGEVIRSMDRGILAVSSFLVHCIRQPITYTFVY